MSTIARWAALLWAALAALLPAHDDDEPPDLSGWGTP